MKVEWLTDPETGRDEEYYDGIPAYEYFGIQGMREATKEESKSIDNYIKSISQKVITIPNEATNGDVMKALFNISLDDFKHKWGGGDITDDWWNAPYKRGDGE